MSDHCERMMPRPASWRTGGGDVALVVLFCAGVLVLLVGVGAVDMQALSAATAVLFTS